LAFGFANLFSFSQNNDTLQVNYFSQNPFAYMEAGNLKGIEIEILSEYVSWLKVRKKVNMVVKHAAFGSFDDFYGSCKRPGKNTIGLGSVTINTERAKEIDFSVPYMKDVAFCVTNGNAPDIKSKSPEEIIRTLGSMSALTINNTSLNRYVVDLKKQYLRELRISYHMDEAKILEEISKNVLYFGYVDAVSFWFYLKNNPGKFLKMQKILSQSSEELGFIMPKGSQHKTWFNEFFNGPTGFRNTPVYRAILEKYLGAYMTQNMAIN
jgi:ABC-type amino acid transport substrate-binding protein